MLTARALRGKRVAIGGGTRGLGLALARRFVALDCDVAICGRDEETLVRATRDLATRGGSVFAMRTDLTDETDARRFVEASAEALGGIDVWISVAAEIVVGPVESMTSRDFRDAMGSIFFSALHPALAAIPILERRGGGSMAFVTSVGGKVALPHLVPYSAAKFAEVGLAEGLRAELAPRGIRVTTVVPGLMRTGSYAHAKLVGDAAAEYVWFGAGATSLALAVDADRAARTIVRAIARGKPTCVIGAPAHLAVRAHDLAPGLFQRAMSLVQRLMPEPAAGGMIEGRALEADGGPAVRAVAQRGARDRVRLNQDA